MARLDSPETIKRKCAERKEARLVPRGRPKGGDRINYMLRNMKIKDSKEILESIIDVAKDTKHKNWSHATKILMDRVANVSHYEKERNPPPSGITINVETVNVGSREIEGLTIEADRD